MGEEKILVAGHLSLDRIKTPDRGLEKQRRIWGSPGLPVH